MQIIGITGGSGSGKSCFCRFLHDVSGASVIDADQVYHDLVCQRSPCTDALAAAFGSEVLYSDGSLNRAALAPIVFAGDEKAKEKLAKLNAITHAFVRVAFEEKIDLCRQKNEKSVLLDVPLLFESGFDALCHHTVSVLAPFAMRLFRICRRDGLDAAAAERRLRAQPTDDFYRERSELIVYNEAQPEQLKKEAERIAEILKII